MPVNTEPIKCLALRTRSGRLCTITDEVYLIYYPVRMRNGEVIGRGVVVVVQKITTSRDSGI